MHKKFKIIKKYLSITEIQSIINEILKYDTYIQRIIVRDILILYYCTNLNLKDDNDNIDATFDTYDKYKLDGTIEKVLSKINEEDLLMINEAIYYEDSIKNIIKEISNNLNDKISNYIENINFPNILASLNEDSKFDKK